MTDISAQLRQWVDEQWPNLMLNDFALKPEFHNPDDRAPGWQALHGDAGFRRYFRLTSEPPLLAVYAPPATEDTSAFIRIARHLRHHGVLAPAIAAVDEAQGFLLIEDLGPTLMLTELNEHSVEGLYAEALSCLLQLQQCPHEGLGLPSYNAERLRAEMQLFCDWFAVELLGYDLSVAERNTLEHWFAELEASALAQPQVIVHRDFHSRNLIYRAEGPPGVIDFQDAVVGPFTYDLVSLLRDCYVSWPEDRVRRWALTYASIAIQAEVIPACSEMQLLKWFDWMGLQRHIKVLGIFARLSLRDGKHGYLGDLPQVLKYTLSVARRYPEAEGFVALIETKLMPLIRQQPWFVEEVV